MLRGTWTNPERGKVALADYAATWISQRPKLRPRTVDHYRWLLKRHIVPYLGTVPLGKLSTPMIRQWRATLLGNGVSVSVAAKAYRLLRAVLMTTTEDDKIQTRNPCRIRGAGDEETAERPVLTVAQVFELAERVGRRPVGNIRKLPAGGYRLRFRRHGLMRTAPEVFRTRPEAEQALWRMADDGRADCNHDRRFGALVLLATFASLRWGEVTALRRCDLDLARGTVRIRAAFVERSTGEILLGPPKSKAGRRVVHSGRDHPGPARAPVGLRQARAGCADLPRRDGRPAAPQQLQQDVGLALRGALDRRTKSARSRSTAHGNTFAASGGAGIRDLMARMGHDSERAALIYQHQARGADKTITSAIDAHIVSEQEGRDDDDGQAGALVPVG